MAMLKCFCSFFLSLPAHDFLFSVSDVKRHDKPEARAPQTGQQERESTERTRKEGRNDGESVRRESKGQVLGMQ